MKKEPSSETKKRIEDGIFDIEKAIIDNETRDSLESVIESYSKIDKTDLIGKQTYLVESLAELCGVLGTEMILNLLNRGSNAGSFKVIDGIENSEVRRFLKRIILKYGAQYQWFLEPFRKDWQRYDFSTKYFGVSAMPIVGWKVINKAGELQEIESPLPAYVHLVTAQIQHLNSVNKEMEKIGKPNAVKSLVGKDLLIKMKQAIDELLEEKKEEK
jgi:hypothetical protein